VCNLFNSFLSNYKYVLSILYYHLVKSWIDFLDYQAICFVYFHHNSYLYMQLFLNYFLIFLSIFHNKPFHYNILLVHLNHLSHIITLFHHFINVFLYFIHLRHPMNKIHIFLYIYYYHQVWLHFYNSLIIYLVEMNFSNIDKNL